MNDLLHKPELANDQRERKDITRPCPECAGVQYVIEYEWEPGEWDIDSWYCPHCDGYSVYGR